MRMAMLGMLAVSRWLTTARRQSRRLGQRRRRAHLLRREHSMLVVPHALLPNARQAVLPAGQAARHERMTTATRRQWAAMAATRKAAVPTCGTRRTRWTMHFDKNEWQG